MKQLLFALVVFGIIMGCDEGLVVPEGEDPCEVAGQTIDSLVAVAMSQIVFERSYSITADGDSVDNCKPDSATIHIWHEYNALINVVSDAAREFDCGTYGSLYTNPYLCED